MFACGQAYVALSRARSLDGLEITDFDYNCVKVSNRKSLLGLPSEVQSLYTTSQDLVPKLHSKRKQSKSFIRHFPALPLLPSLPLRRQGLASLSCPLTVEGS